MMFCLIACELSAETTPTQNHGMCTTRRYTSFFPFPVAHLILLGTVKDFFGFWFRTRDKKKDKNPTLRLPGDIIRQMDTRIKAMNITREYTRKPNAPRYDNAI